MPLTGGSDGIIVHGTAITRGSRAVLLRGPSGAGKSDLALRALATPLDALDGTSGQDGFQLVGDDQVVVRRSGDGLTVHAHPRLAGLIEVRGIGIVPVAHAGPAALVLIAELVSGGAVDRLPDPWPTESLLGITLPVLRIVAFEASAPLKLALALAQEPWRAEVN